VVERHVAAEMAVPADDGVADFGVPADPAVRPDDRPFDDGVFLDLGLPSDDGVGAHACARLDGYALVDEAGPLDGSALLDARPGGDRGACPGEATERVGGKAAVHDVPVHLRVLLRRADVDPVAVVDVGHEGLTPFDQGREEAALDRPRHVPGNPVERIRLEDVDTRVDVVRGDLIGVRLLEEPGDVAGRIGFDQSEGGRVLDRGQHDGGLRLTLAMQPDDRAEVDLRQHVAVENHDGFREVVAGIPDGAGGPEWRRLDDVPDLDAQLRPVPEDLLDAAGLIVEAEDDLVDLRHLLQQVELIVEKRPVEDRDNRFWRVDGERPQPRPLPSGEKDRLHDKPRSYSRMRTSPGS